MKRLLLALVFVSPCVAQADEPFFGTEKAASVLNQPKIALEVGKAATNVVEPGFETLYDIRLGEWRQGTSMVLWTFKKDDAAVASIRAGFAIDYLPYISSPIELKTAANKYLIPVLPETVKGYLGAGPLDVAWNALGKYGTVGPWFGINLDRKEDGNQHDGGLAYGVSVGAKLTF